MNILKQEQTSPNDKTRAPQTGNFATAWIDHGCAPKQAAYEYAVYIQPTNKEITRLIKKDGYEVLRRDNTAHVVKDLATGITGYVCFGEYTGQGLVRKVTGESIVMERTDTDGQVVMSVCTPDLGLTEKTYTTRQESRPIEKEVLLDACRTISRRGGRFPRHRNAAEDNLPPRTARGVPAQEEITIFTHNLI